MVFAVETYCPATDGISAARIEEEVILTPNGPQIISLYPARGAADRQSVLSRECDDGRRIPTASTGGSHRARRSNGTHDACDDRALGWIGIGRMGYAMARAPGEGAAPTSRSGTARARRPSRWRQYGAKIADARDRARRLRHRVRAWCRPGTT